MYLDLNYTSGYVAEVFLYKGESELGEQQIWALFIPNLMHLSLTFFIWKTSTWNLWL